MEMRKLKKTILMMTVTIAAFALCGCGKTKIDLNSYMNVECTGYDSFGKADADFDYESFVEDFEDTEMMTKAGKEADDGLRDMAGLMGLGRSDAAMLAMYIKGAFDKPDGLSNGDTVTYSWDLDEDEIYERFNCKLIYSDITVEVDGLEPIGVFDPFEGLQVSFTGTAPYGQVNLSSNRSSEGNLTFNIDKVSNLSNGDEVTISVEYDEQYMAESYHAIPERDSMTVTVEGLPYYLQSASEVDDDMLEKMKSQTEDVILSMAAGWKGASLNGMEYMGNYFLKPKDAMPGIGNELTIVYRIDATASFKNESSDVSFYYAVQFHDIMELADGTQSVDLSRYDKIYRYAAIDSGVNNGWWGTVKFDGYPELDSLFNEVVTKNVEKFEYENNVN